MKIGKIILKQHILFGILLINFHVLAQEIEVSDTLEYDVVNLENAVITGQYSTQSIDKSIYQVEVISEEDIKNFGGNTVADVLNHNLNMMIIPSQSTGDSEIQIMGLGGNYTKVLIDNIPVVGDQGVGVNIDLTKLNLDNIERIEIVKGAMGVDYGNNALMGVINIITKKSLRGKWKITTHVQEETVNKEYDWYRTGGATKGKGRHIQALEVSHNLSNHWFLSAGMDRNDFKGYRGESLGPKVVSKRGYEWLPKETFNWNVMANYRSPNFKAFYKANYLHEFINYYNPDVNPRSIGETGQTYVANDRNYRTLRFIHHLNLDAKLFNRVKFIGDFSYQTQDRKLQKYTYDIPNREVLSESDFNTYSSSKTFYSRGTFSNFLNSKTFDFQVGYEMDYTNGFRSRDSGEGLFPEDLDKNMGTYAGFISAEFKANRDLSFRPGFRANFSSKFDKEFDYSLSARFRLSKTQDLRAVIGTTNRYPGFDELYTRFVDSNHDVRGNQNLNPERGHSTSIQWNNKTKTDGGLKMSNSISTLFINLTDKIELSVINLIPLRYQYINIDKYESWGINTDHQFIYNNLSFSLGASFYGITRKFQENDKLGLTPPDDDYRYTLELNAAANYKIPKWGTTISAYYKYSGKRSQYVLEDAIGGNPKYKLGEQAPFSLLDASIRKGFYHDRFEVTFGVRNLLNVGSITNTIEAGQAHSDNTSQMMLLYGRSYFLKLNYTLDL